MIYANRIPKLCILLSIVVAMPATLSAQVYKSVDKDGNVVYSDSPPTPGAKPMKMPELSVVPAPPIAKVPIRPSQSKADANGNVTDLKALQRGYRDFKLISPAQEQTFAGTGNDATVAWSTRYDLQPGMTVVINLDGKPLAPTTDQSVLLKQLDRGTHTVSADLVDAQQRKIASTDTVKFYIHQNSVNFNRPQNSPANGS